MSRLSFLFLIVLLASPARSKVVFTGYGDLRYNTGINARISGTEAVLSPLGLGAGRLTTRGFSADAIGLFSTAQIDDSLQFLVDIDFRNVGDQVGRLTLLYAYLDWRPAPPSAVHAGRILLPFGYYNENRFYAFQRPTITAPVFQSGILGLPIADWGVSARQRWALNPLTLEAAAYVVNGYGHSQTREDALRLATLPGGLTLAASHRASDNNHQPAVGGRVQAVEIGGGRNAAGASYYWGTWDASGLQPLQIVAAHVQAEAAGLDFLAEGLRMAVRGDEGFAASIGTPNWTTTGGFAVASYSRLAVRGKALRPYVQGEYYRTKPNDGGRNREVLRSVSAGAALKVSAQLTVKAEYIHFVYELPDVDAGPLELRADGALLSAVVTF